ncbi:Alpha/beta hydrolase family protein [Caballeronia catudaia]|uniref:Alpha/beta hydrolase family protein n=1 Tax=Caballeronia catudaia TaxID=1777136 RepID=A0A158CNT4_9BURK|nr:alpha/beta hydrolase [Caballeronia catudaia]SAK84014.1 Alpha/beta hydrolase family protein [Caballeronia catudaia]
MNADIDIRHVLPSIRVPTLILHNCHDRVVSPDATRYMADLIPGAKLVELNGIDHIPWGDNGDAILEEIEDFLTGVRHSSEYDRVLATVLFTDIASGGPLIGNVDIAASGISCFWQHREHPIAKTRFDTSAGSVAPRGNQRTCQENFIFSPPPVPIPSHANASDGSDSPSMKVQYAVGRIFSR